MTWNSKHFLWVIILIIFVVAGYRFYEYVILKNFDLQVNTICDPHTESCFDSSDESISFGQSPYEKVLITARYAPQCLEEHNCESFSCPVIAEKSGVCEITYCSEENLEEGESCTEATSTPTQATNS